MGSAPDIVPQYTFALLPWALYSNTWGRLIKCLWNWLLTFLWLPAPSLLAVFVVVPSGGVGVHHQSLALVPHLPHFINNTNSSLDDLSQGLHARNSNATGLVHQGGDVLIHHYLPGLHLGLWSKAEQPSCPQSPSFVMTQILHTLTCTPVTPLPTSSVTRAPIKLSSKKEKGSLGFCMTSQYHHKHIQNYSSVLSPFS